MKFKNIRKNILLIVLIIFIVCIILFGLIRYVNLHEGILYVDGTDNINTKSVVISATTTSADYLHLTELGLYGDNGKIKYDAVSNVGFISPNGYENLTDSDKTTHFHSDKSGDGRTDCTLTLTPKMDNPNSSPKITKIIIRNRSDNDIAMNRLKGYKISIIRNDNSVFYTKNLAELPNLYVPPYMEEILIK